MSNKPETKKAPAPRLRFPEFESDWVTNSGNELFKQISNKKHNSDLPILAVTQDKGAVPRDEINYHVSATSESIESYKVIDIGDFIISLRSFQGGIEYSNYRGICSPAYVILRGGEKVSSDYFRHYFKSEIFIKNLTKNLEGLRDGKMISYKQFSEVAIPISTFEEQQRIADCLSSLDTVIKTQTDRLTALRQHKTGLMQQLFPAEGETVPELRFPEFAEAGDWEEKKTGTLFANRIAAGEKGLPIYSVTVNDGIVKRSSLDRKIDDITKFEGNKKACANDIAYNMMRMWQGAFGVVPEDCMVSPAYVILRPQKDVNSSFFGYLLKLPKYLRLLTSHSQGLTLDRLRLYYKDFAQIPVLIPDFSEQQRIAAFLFSIDTLINAQSKKIDELKTFKRGLMQSLFPAGDEA